MDLSELQKEVDRDIKIDDTELDLESIRTPQLHNKYLKQYTKYSLQLKKVRDDYKYLHRVKWEYYTGKADPSVYQIKPFNIKLLKPDVDKYIKADEDMIKLEQKVTYVQSVVDYLDRTVKIISNRGFQIKNAIDWRKFTSGVI